MEAWCSQDRALSLSQQDAILESQAEGGLRLVEHSCKLWCQPSVQCSLAEPAGLVICSLGARLAPHHQSPTRLHCRSGGGQSTPACLSPSLDLPALHSPSTTVHRQRPSTQNIIIALLAQLAIYSPSGPAWPVKCVRPAHTVAPCHHHQLLIDCRGRCLAKQVSTRSLGDVGYHSKHNPTGPLHPGSTPRQQWT